MFAGPVAWVRPGVGAWIAYRSDSALSDDDGLFNGRTSIVASSMTPFPGAAAAPATVESGDVVMAFRVDFGVGVFGTVDLSPKSGPGVFFTQLDRRRAIEGMVIPIVVTREGGSDGAASLAYATRAGAGTGSVAGVDYQSVSGVLEFAPGEMEKIISIPTIDNGAYNGQRSIQVTLAGNSVTDGNHAVTIKLTVPQDCVLARTSATLTIVDDDPAPPRHRSAKH